MGGTTLSKDTLKSIASYYKSKDTHFFKPIVGLRSEDNQMGILFKSSDSKVERETLPNGDIQVRFTYALDNNKDASDGRILIKDEFVFSSSDQKFKSYYRSFSYNQKGTKGDWQAWLKKYKALRHPTESMAKDFADSVVKPFVKNGSVTSTTSSSSTSSTSTSSTKGTSISSNSKFIPSLGSDGKKYILSAAKLAQDKVYSQLSLKVKDPQSTYLIEKSGSDYKVTISYVVIAYSSSDNTVEMGKIFMTDTFLLDGKSKQLKNFKGRKWTLEKRLQNEVTFYEFPKKLNNLSAPTFSEAETYIHNLVPAIFPGTSRPTDTSTTTSTSSSSGTSSTSNVNYKVKKSGSRYTITFDKNSTPGRRKDTSDTVMASIAKYAERPYMSVAKNFPFSGRIDAKLYFDNKTGNITKVQFKVGRLSGKNGSPPDSLIQRMLARIAYKAYLYLSLKQGEANPIKQPIIF